MNLVNQSAFLKALGWTLLDSLWQFGILWLVYLLLTANGRKFQSRQRHSLALLSLAGGSAWFLVTLVVNLYKAARLPQVITLHVNTNEVTTVSSSLFAQLSHWLEPLLPFLSVGYLIITIFLFIRFYRQYRYTQRLYTAGLTKADPALRVFLQQSLQHLGIKKKVTIWLSSLVDAPLTIGFWKPVILLPVAAINHLSLQQAEAIILHELNHIRRNDYLLNLLIACAEILLFFNPFAALLSNTIRKERENSCDDLVLQFRYDAATYAKALLRLEQNRLQAQTLAIAATGSSKLFLLNRVKRILSNEPVVTPISQKLSAYLLSALLIGFIGWYNPGKVIVTTIVEKTNTRVISEESAHTFTTPASTSNEIAETKPKRNNHKHTSEAAKDNYEQNEDEAVPENTGFAAVADTDDESNNGNIYTVAPTFASSQQVVEFSMPEPVNATPKEYIMQPQVYPFVPANSFTFKSVEDTTLPKKYILSYSDQQAQEVLDKALQALSMVDWQKLEQQLKGKKLNVITLQQELKKALKEVDWKKINEESQGTLKALDETDVLKASNIVLNKIAAYQRSHMVRQTQTKTLQEQIVNERLQLSKKMNTEKKPCKVKKIVNI